MALDLVPFSQLAGAPVQPAPRKIGQATLTAIVRALSDLWLRCPWGRASLVVHGGAYVDRPDPAGTDRHAQGRALDIMHLEWTGVVVGPSRILASATDLRRYLAVTAVLEQHLGCVLNYWQPDSKHRSHWHLDDHREPGWSPTWRPSVRFLQAALHELLGHDEVQIDGTYGPKTRGAAEAEFGELANGAVWGDALAEIARRGFAGA